MRENYQKEASRKKGKYGRECYHWFLVKTTKRENKEKGILGQILK
jgi:hypothetical protein